jgi:hypothetical protein
MRHPSTLGIVIRPASVAPLRELLVALLAGAVALRQLDWWKLLARAGHLPTRRRQILVHVAAIGFTFTGTDASEEIAEDEESPLRSAMGHALLRVALEAMLFYTLLTLAIACGLSDGENGNHENDALAYLADTVVGGWGEPFIHTLGCLLFIAACEWTRAMIVAFIVAMFASGSTRSVKNGVGATPLSTSSVVNPTRRQDKSRSYEPRRRRHLYESETQLYRATAAAHAPHTTRASTIAAYSLPMKRSKRVVCNGSADSS